MLIAASFRQQPVPLAVAAREAVSLSVATIDRPIDRGGLEQKKMQDLRRR